MDYGDVECQPPAGNSSREDRIKHVIEFNKQVSPFFHAILFYNSLVLGIHLKYVVVIFF